MKRDKVIIKLKSINYSGDSVGNDIVLEIKILNQIFTFNPPIKLNETLELNNEIIRSDLTVALAYCESKFDPLAISKTGAKGIFQLTGITRTQLRNKLNFDIGENELFDIDKNITGGIIYLSWIWKRYKGKQDEYEKFIAAWNAGRSVIPMNGPITFTKIKDVKKRAEAKQLVACVITNWKK